MQELPKYHETFKPILEILKDGRIVTAGDLRKLVRDQFYANLPQELLDQRTKNGDQLILNRIGWGKAYLKQAKMVEQPERGMVKISDKGLLALQSDTLSLEDITNDPDFVTHRKKQQMKSEVAQGVSTSASPQDLVDAGIQEIEEQTKADLLDRIKDLDTYYFERVVLELFHKMGYGKFIETSKSGDGGIDGIINQDQLGLEKIYVQVKRYRDKEIRETDIRNFIGAMSGDTQKGIFVTTSEFHDSATQKAKEAHHTIVLVDGFMLSDLMYIHNVGVQLKNSYEVKEVDEDFFEAD